ncbi:hypothetical protein AB0D08_00380 [Kitasatospora sp. NPDC048540]|uniref:hypothetical protein n=1 Tax=Kitasatospora sp. NPDC048540 TaxID=3155634 RepID=UPI0033E31020
MATITVCDEDMTEVGKPTESYTITSGDRTVTKDLCADHAAPLEALLSGQSMPATATLALTGGGETPVESKPVSRPRKAATDPKPLPAPARPARRRPKIRTVEEIEAEKSGKS